jgi:hypothetical protein
MPEEKDISTDDVKKQFEELQNKPAEATEETSTEETEAAAPSAGDDKTETAEKTELDDESKPIPYSRFKEVNERKRELEELAEQAKEYIVKDPVTGKMVLKMPQKETVQQQEDKEPQLVLTDEEQLALDSVQMTVVEKLFNVWQAKQHRQSQQQNQYRQQTDDWWNKTKEDYPELKAANFKELPIYQRALNILKEQHIVWSPDKKTFYIPPNAQYLSMVQAEKEMAREKAKTSQAKIEEKKGQKQTIFVEKKSSQAPVKKVTKVEEFENSSALEQDAILKAQFDEANSTE